MPRLIINFTHFKDNYRKKDEYSNYNDYNRSMNKSNYSSGGKKRYDQRNPNRSNHQHSQHQRKFFEELDYSLKVLTPTEL